MQTKRDESAITSYYRNMDTLKIVSADQDYRPLVLVADDEAIVRAVVSSMLERLGCRVIQAADGASAMRLFTEHHHEISLVIFDLMLPDMTGEYLYEQLTRISQPVRGLLVTGYSDSDMVNRMEVGQLQGVLSKPFDFAELQGMLGRALAA